jgi:hypothetical protein
MPREDTQFKIGNPGGPGRPKGSKNKLSENFVYALAEDFKKGGIEAIERLREDSPGEYLRIIAHLIPKELLLEVSTEQRSYVINCLPTLTSEQWAKEAIEYRDRATTAIEAPNPNANS